MSRVRVAVSALAACLLLGSVGIGAEAIARRGDQRSYPAPGRIVTVGDRQMHITCTGPANRPAVVLEAGIGESSLTWVEVQRLLSPSMRVCAYDRSGYGWSAPTDQPRDARTQARDLHDLLHAAQVEPPYVLVGHGYGTWVARTFAADYPDLIAGAVLIDPPNEQPFLNEGGDTLADSVPYVMLEVSGWIGVTRLVGNSMATRLLPDDTPKEIHERATWLYRREVAHTAVAEMGSARRSAGQLATIDEATIWAERPLAVISAADSTQEDRRFDASLARLAPEGTLALAHRGGSYVHYADPRLVAELVRVIWKQAAYSHTP